MASGVQGALWIEHEPVIVQEVVVSVHLAVSMHDKTFEEHDAFIVQEEVFEEHEVTEAFVPIDVFGAEAIATGFSTRTKLAGIRIRTSIGTLNLGKCFDFIVFSKHSGRAAGRYRCFNLNEDRRSFVYTL
jgi:hypothetical protein